MSESAEISGRLDRGVRRAASRSRHFLADCWVMNWDRLVVDRDWCCMVVDGKVVGSKVGVVGCGVGGHIVVRLQGGELVHFECGECKERLLFIVFRCDLLHNCLEWGCIGFYNPSDRAISVGRESCSIKSLGNPSGLMGMHNPCPQAISAVGNVKPNTSLLSAVFV